MSAKQYRVLLQKLRLIEDKLNPELYAQEMEFLRRRIKTYKLIHEIQIHVPEYTIPQFPNLVNSDELESCAFRHEHNKQFTENNSDVQKIFAEFRNIIFERANIYYDVLTIEQSEGVYFMYNQTLSMLTSLDLMTDFYYIGKTKNPELYQNHMFSESLHNFAYHIS